MSDKGHQVRASKTFSRQAGTIRKNSFIVIKDRPCKVVEVSTSETGEHGEVTCHFVGVDIFNGKKLEDTVPFSLDCEVPNVTRKEYYLLDISPDGFVSLVDDSGNTKEDVRLPSDETLVGKQIMDEYDEEKELVVIVMSAMGEEQICAFKHTRP